MMFFFLSVSIRCLTKGKLKKRKHGKHIFLKQYAFQTRGSSAVGVSCESKLLVRADVAGRVGVYIVRDRFLLLSASSFSITKYFYFLLFLHFASSRESFLPTSNPWGKSFFRGSRPYPTNLIFPSPSTLIRPSSHLLTSLTPLSHLSRDDDPIYSRLIPFAFAV